MERVTRIEQDVVLEETRLIELFDRTIETFKRAPVTFLASSALADVPLTVVGVLIYLLGQTGEYRADTLPYILQAVGLSLVFSASMLAKFVSEGAVARATADVVGLSGQSRMPTVARSWRAALSSASPLILLGILRSVILVGGILFMGIPSLIAVVLMGYWAQVATLERRTATESLGRLLKISRGGWHLAIVLVGVFAFAFLVVFVNVLLLARILLMVTLAFTPFDPGTFLTIPVILVGSLLITRILVEPLTGIGFTLAYIDARVRTEGYDMRVRAERAARAAHGLSEAA